MLTERLKNDNWALHQIAERQPTPGSLIKGTMPKEGYLAMLGQQYLLNSAFDAALAEARTNNPQVESLIDQEYLLTPYLIEDLEHFGIERSTLAPTPGTQRFIDHVAAHKDQPLHLLGLHYVRLGACNGNTFVARVVRKSYNITDPTQGTRYLDPFGKEQRKGWVAFKESLDSIEFTDAQQDEVFAGTRAAYVLSINLDFEQFKDAETLLLENGQSLDKNEFDAHHSAHISPAMHAELDA